MRAITDILAALSGIPHFRKKPLVSAVISTEFSSLSDLQCTAFIGDKHSMSDEAFNVMAISSGTEACTVTSYGEEANE